MNTKKRFAPIAIAVALSLIATPAFAALVLVEQSTKTKGATTITWDSSFHDMDYTLGATITMPVNWTVDAGAASYHSFALKRFTPRSWRDPADGAVTGIAQSGNAVTVVFEFTDLHLDAERGVCVGNAHFKLYLMIDEDGDGTPETLAGYGVNVHVEDQDESNCPVDGGGGGAPGGGGAGDNPPGGGWGRGGKNGANSGIGQGSGGGAGSGRQGRGRGGS